MTEEEASKSEMSDIDRIKAAHVARLARRRSRPPRPPTSSIIPPPDVTEDNATNNDKEDNNSNDNNNDNSNNNKNKDSKMSEEEIQRLQTEISSLRLELSSLRRNHLQNIKVISEQRDMFAEQLAREQSNDSNNNNSNTKSSKKKDSDAKKLADVEVQLRAARIRNSDLEEENQVLRDEVKQLSFRLQASKTLDAASNGYQKVVDDLVESKLKCAQLLEEKEDLLRINKELTTTSAVLRDANGDLEKSRSQWVLQCAEVEKKRTELENRLNEKQTGVVDSGTKNHGRTSLSSDLQELKL